MQEALRKLKTTETDEQRFFNDVIAGLTQAKKTLQPKYFYDRQGSEYFDRICQLEEYYPYKTELALLPKVAEDLQKRFDRGQAIVEFGAGSLKKIRPLLNKIDRITTYIPIDISGDHLKSCCAILTKEYPALDVRPVIADFTDRVALPANRSEENLGFFPGSTIGNFSPANAISFLRNARNSLGKHGLLLIGVDTKKSPRTLHRAYNDEKNITARFNLNILERINRELNGSFDTGKFEHYAYYNARRGCIEMHLVCTERYTARIDGIAIEFEAGESIHTENSYKYTPDEFTVLAKDAGWQVEKLWLARNDLFSIYLLGH